jgi:hypothetical protein
MTNPVFRVKLEAANGEIAHDYIQPAVCDDNAEVAGYLARHYFNDTRDEHWRVVCTELIDDDR